MGISSSLEVDFFILLIFLVRFIIYFYISEMSNSNKSRWSWAAIFYIRILCLSSFYCCATVSRCNGKPVGVIYPTTESNCVWWWVDNSKNLRNCRTVIIIISCSIEASSRTAWSHNRWNSKYCMAYCNLTTFVNVILFVYKNLKLVAMRRFNDHRTESSL